MVLKYPGAAWDPLGTQTEPKMVAHDILCYHTMVGSLAGTRSMFKANGYGGTESTFGVGESKAQGVLQWQDGMYQADANYEGNPRVTSIETADYGGIFGKWDTSNAANVPAWSNDQLDMLVAIGVWYCRKETHANCPSTWKCHQVGVPAVLIPDTKPGRRGLAYHMQGCRPHVVAGGEVWSTAYGKVCPGNRRTTQLKTIVIPRIRAILGGAVISGSLDMNFSDPIPGYTDPDGTSVTVGEALVRGNYAYRSVLEGGPIENRVSALEFTMHGNNGVIDVLETLDQRIKALVTNEVIDDKDLAATKTALEALKTRVTTLETPAPSAPAPAPAPKP